MNRRTFLKQAGGLSTAALLWPSLSLTGLAQARQELRLGYLRVEACAQHFVAVEQGIFARNGLRVTGQAMAGGAVVAPAVEGGSLDVGWSNTISLIIAHARGFDFKILTPGVYEIKGAGGARRSIMVPVDSSVREPKDLAGKTISVNTLGNVSELVVLAWLERGGVRPGQVRLVEVDYPDMPAALESGRVDAALVIEPFVTIAENRGGARSIAEYVFSEAVTERFFIASWFAKEAWIRAHRDLVARFERSISEAIAFIRSDPEGTKRAIQQYTPLSPQVLAQMETSVYPEEVYVEDLQALVEATVRYGFIDRPFDARELLPS